MDAANFVLGLISVSIALIGFGIIIYNVTKTKKLSIQIRDDLKRVDSVSLFSSAISCLEEIKTLHRMGAWLVLPDKYTALRKALITIREINPDISDESKKTIQSTISTLASTENIIEKANISGTPPPNVPNLNRTISKKMDELHPIVLEIQSTIGR